MLKEVTGEETTLGSDKLRTLLMIVLRNATTDSPWPLSNNPRAKYNDLSVRGAGSNLHLPLWQLVRASAAAPTYFPPEVVKSGGQHFVFVDGGVTMYNNPAFQLFLMATTEPYRLCWPTGQDQMLIISVGTGASANAKNDLTPREMNLIYNASNIPSALMAAALHEQDFLCRVFGKCLAGDLLDREVGDVIGQGIKDVPKLFTYVRYNAELSRAGLDALGLQQINPGTRAADGFSGSHCGDAGSWARGGAAESERDALFLGASLFDRLQDAGDDFGARLGAKVSLAMDADADRAGFEVATPDHEHGVDFHLLGSGDFGFDVIVARVELGTDFVGTQFGLDGAGVFEERCFVADGQDTDLFRREPEREVAGIMLDQETDESLVRAQRRAMNAERRRFRVLAGFVNKPKPGRDGEVDLISRDAELAADRAPDLDIDLRSVKSGFVRHFDVVDPAPLQDAAHHFLGLKPERTVIDELLAQLRRIVGGETHEVFLDPEEPEILQIHLIDGVKLLFELLLGAVDVGVVHLERAHPHEPEELARLFVAIVRSVFGEAEWEVAITVRHRGKELVMMRAVHRLEVVVSLKG